MAWDRCEPVWNDRKDNMAARASTIHLMIMFVAPAGGLGGCAVGNTEPESRDIASVEISHLEWHTSSGDRASLERASRRGSERAHNSVRTAVASSGRVQQSRLRRLVATCAFDRSVAVTGDNLYGFVARRRATSELSDNAVTAWFDISEGQQESVRGERLPIHWPQVAGFRL